MHIIGRESRLRFLLSGIKQYYLNASFKAEWRKSNAHNKTMAINRFPIEKVTVGKGTYGDLRVLSFGGKKEGLEIGNYCSIAGDVVFILGGVHRTDTVSTYPFARHVFSLPTTPDSATKGKIIVDDDVWICHGVVITSGVHIGQGAVIGAGSVVTKDVPPYSVFLGHEVRRYRFPSSIINELLKIDFKSMTLDQLDKFKPFCGEKVTDDNVRLFVKSLTE